MSDGCTDDLLATSAVGMVRKHAANPENLIAGAFQRPLDETCRLLTEAGGTLRTYAEMCGAEPEVNLRVAGALGRLRALLCGDTTVTADAAAEWTCWQPRATSFWNCAQQTGWTSNPEACQLLDKLSECYERVAVDGCGAGSGRTARRLVLRALVPLPESQCPELARAARGLQRDHSVRWVLVVVNVAVALVVLGCCAFCAWYRFRRRRHSKLQEEGGGEEASHLTGTLR